LIQIIYVYVLIIHFQFKYVEFNYLGKIIIFLSSLIQNIFVIDHIIAHHLLVSRCHWYIFNSR